MKKIFLFLGIVFIIFSFSGCFNTKLLSLKQSQKNFDYYEQQLNVVLKENGLTMREEESEFGTYRLFSIHLDKSNTIDVEIRNNGTNDSNGREDFSVYYFGSGGDLDIKLFTKIVNVISSREISENYCKQFILDKNKKYEMDTKDNEIIYKRKCLNFWEDWWLWYTLYDDNSRILGFYGLTKYGTRQ